MEEGGRSKRKNGEGTAETVKTRREEKVRVEVEGMERGLRRNGRGGRRWKGK